MIAKAITYFGKPCIIACDSRCDKAWGINGRPRKRFSETEPDDYVYLGDDEIDGKAPGPGRTVGISEGGDIKPSDGPLLSGQHMNKWCTRECERSAMSENGEPFSLPDMKTPRPNMPWLHPATQAPRAPSGGADA